MNSNAICPRTSPASSFSNCTATPTADELDRFSREDRLAPSQRARTSTQCEVVRRKHAERSAADPQRHVWRMGGGSS